MADFKPTAIKRFAELETQEINEKRFWRAFKAPVIHQLNGPVSSVQFAGTAPYDWAVTSGTRVSIYTAAANDVRRNYSRFTSPARSGVLKQDGSVLAAACDEGLVTLFEARSRVALRQIKASDGPVHAVRWLPRGTTVDPSSSSQVGAVAEGGPATAALLTAADDCRVALWDVHSPGVGRSGSIQTPVAAWTVHSDYVRAADVAPSAAAGWTAVTGSYDHTVALWDARTAQGVVARWSVGAPVTSVLALPGSGTVAAASKEGVSIWSLLKPGVAMASFKHHTKAVTSLCVDGSGTRLLSAGLDGLVQVTRLDTWANVASIRHPVPLLSVAVSPDNQRLVVGSTQGTVTIRSRNRGSGPAGKMSAAAVGAMLAAADAEAAAAGLDAAPAHPAPIRGGSARFFARGASSTAREEDVTASEVGKKRKLRAHDKALKKFEHRAALDAALADGTPVVVVSVVEELLRRQALQPALLGRDDASLAPVLAWLQRWVVHPRYSEVALILASAVLDLYAARLSTSTLLLQAARNLRSQVIAETKAQQELLKVVGALDALGAAAGADDVDVEGVAAVLAEVPGVPQLAPALHVELDKPAPAPSPVTARKRGLAGAEDPLSALLPPDALDELGFGSDIE